MTEDEWKTAHDAWRMLHVVERSKPSERKVRLFNAAICKRFWQYLPAESQAILRDSELLADGKMSIPDDPMELCKRANVAVAPFNRQYPNKEFPNDDVRYQRYAAAAVCYAVIPGELWGAVSYFWELDSQEKEPHAVIIRDVFGNPAHPVAVHPSWRTSKVVTLAGTIYDEQAFHWMPELSDALEEAGCLDAGILQHCCNKGLHVRGCWLIDLLLDKT